MKTFIIFTEEELDRMKDGGYVVLDETIYCSEEGYGEYENAEI